jgi:hypothetical protein
MWSHILYKINLFFLLIFLLINYKKGKETEGGVIPVIYVIVRPWGPKERENDHDDRNTADGTFGLSTFSY